jgi:EmrB/QacA subfamily drug resistance transporter
MSLPPAAQTTPTAQTERWVLIATILASSMAFIDGTALNVALPAIQTSLSASGSEVFWVISAYNLFLAALILVGGSLGDLIGRKRVFTGGIILFTLASVVCGFANDAPMLILARVVQGIGGAFMVPGSLSILSAVFPQNRRGTAIGTWSTFTTVMLVIGPVLGGWLASQGLWRGIFFINLPLAVFALYALQSVPESRDPNARRLDLSGAVLATVGLAGLTYGFIQGAEVGLSHPSVLLALGAGAAALVAFVLVEARIAAPMVPLSLFRSRTFSGANLVTLFLYSGLAVYSLFVSLNLVQIQGYDESQAGLAMVPFAFMLIVMSRWAGGLVARIGPRIPLTIGPALAGIGFYLFSQLGLTPGPSAYWTTFFPAMLLVGLGMGVTVAPLTTAVMGSAPTRSAGVASGINNAVARVANVLAVAILGGLALVVFTGLLSTISSDVPLTPEQQTTLLTVEAPKLGAAVPPAGLSAQAATRIEQAIDRAFIQTYQLVMGISAALAWLSALIGLLLVEARLLSDERPVSATSALPDPDKR